MKILVIGANGMLGHKLIQVLEANHEVTGTVREDSKLLQDLGVFRGSRIVGGIDILDTDLVRTLVRDNRPDVVINATGVIKHREAGKEAVVSIRVNSLFPHLLNEITKEYGSRLICFSTDCVFNGRKGLYSEEDPNDAFDIYGKTKALGEVTDKGCITIRSSIIGRELGAAHSLVEWFLTNRGNSAKGFVNALYTGFTTLEMASIVEMLITRFPGLNGLYHVSSDVISKYDLLKLINRSFDLGIEIEKELEFKMDRSLSSQKFRDTTGFRPKDWPTMIDELAGDAVHYETWRNQIT